MAEAQIWDAFRSFLTTVTETATGFLRDESQCQTLARHLPVVDALNPEGTVGALRAYFTQVPAHWNAINRLDHSLLVNVLDLGGGGCMDFRVIMEPFSKLGPVPHGNVWLALVQLAHTVNPANVNLAECQSFIRSQMATDGTAGAAAGIQLPAPAQLESVMGSIVNAFPGLQDCMSQIMSGDTGNGPDDVNAIVDRVQSVLVQPLLASLRSSNPDAPDLSPAISKILDGFRGLNAAISPGAGSNMDM
jgi:hypothetical protein